MKFLFPWMIQGAAVAVCAGALAMKPNPISAVALLWVLFCVFLMIRNQWVSREAHRYIVAVRDYQMKQIDNGQPPLAGLWDSVPDFDAVMFRFWRWRYEDFVRGPVLVQRTENGYAIVSVTELQ